MTRGSIRDYAAAIRGRYLVAGKVERTRLLDEFCGATGYHRKSAVRLLGRQPPAVGAGRGRKRQYGLAVAGALQEIWEVSDHLCSKRLAPFLPELVAALERHGEVTLEGAVRAQVIQLSAATIDRLLRPVRLPSGRRPFTQGTAATTLKAQIPLRTFGEWAGVRPGAVQADLVMHCGESADGFYLATLDVVDVATGWTDCDVVWGKGQERVGTAVHHARQRLPFALRELHTDNGSEFLNAVLYPWCRREGIHFTRGRPYKKNDQAYVEQKNWSVVRRVVGYDRYSTKAAYGALQEVYAVMRLYINFFQPIRRLVSKERVGAKVSKHFDVAQTPYRRLTAAGILTETQRASLECTYRRLNPVQLRAQIDQALAALWKLADRRSEARLGATAVVAELEAPPAADELSTNPRHLQREQKESSKERKEKAATTTAAIAG